LETRTQFYILFYFLLLLLRFPVYPDKWRDRDLHNTLDIGLVILQGKKILLFRRFFY